MPLRESAVCLGREARMQNRRSVVEPPPLAARGLWCEGPMLPLGDKQRRRNQRGRQSQRGRTSSSTG